uniref:Uncharacterized protein n=3 Tax=Aegilops tauschii subsp. strangulata TaxID=200361 RepID=A0A453PQX3_AEGTS
MASGTVSSATAISAQMAAASATAASLAPRPPPMTADGDARLGPGARRPGARRRRVSQPAAAVGLHGSAHHLRWLGQCVWDERIRMNRACGG